MVCEDCQLIGVDIGGSFLKVGRFALNGQLLAELEIPTPTPSMPGAITVALTQAINLIDPNHKAPFVGIGLPGPMDTCCRIARICINLPGWVDVPLADWLEPRLNRKVILGNDGNCALLGEAWRGAAQGFQDVLLLTLGTGVGGGVMIGGTLFSGHNGTAAEPGLICLDHEGPACNSGNRGSLEQFASSAGLKRLSQVEPDELNELADLGDPRAIEVWDRYGRILGTGISSLIYVLAPELILIGGGLSRASTHFLPSLQKEVEKRVQPVNRKGLLIRTCALGNGAGRLGAARLALERYIGFEDTP